MLCFGIRITAQIPLRAMQIWYLFQMMHFFWPRVHGIESCAIFLFGSVPNYVLKMISCKNIKLLEKANQIWETTSRENYQIFRIS